MANKRKMLVIENDPDWQNIIADIVGDSFKIIQALDPINAIKLYESNPDVTIILMAGYLFEDNEEDDTTPLTELIREKFSGIMIAISSSKHMNNKLLKAGCNYFCAKDYPFDLGALIQKLFGDGEFL